MDISGLAQAGFLPAAYFESEKEMDTVLAPTRIDANGNVDTRSVLERDKAAGVDDIGTSHEGRVGGSTYGMMARTRFNFIMTKVNDTVAGMDERYTQTMNEIASERPELAAKDWDFTVNEDNEIEIIEGENSLTESEIEYLQEKLEGFAEEFGTVAEGLSAAYQTYKEAGSGAPDHLRYDLKRENFAEVFRGREFMTMDKPDLNNAGYDIIGNMSGQLMQRGADLKLDLPQDSNVRVDVKV